MIDFKQNKVIVVQPTDLNIAYTFSFPPASASGLNDGAIPYGTTISSATVVVKKEDIGTDITSQIIVGVSNTVSTVTTTLKYPAVAGSGTYYMTFSITLNTGSVIEFDYILEVIDRPLGSFIEKIIRKIKDESDSDSPYGKLVYPTDYISCVNEALKRYSKIKPRKIVKEITGDSGYDYALPSGWETGFSNIISLEYPSGDRIPQYLRKDYYSVYTDLQGDPKVEVEIIRFFCNTPSTTEKFRVTFTIMHTISTLPEKDKDAVNNLACGLCCEILSTYYAHTSSSMITADSVDYKSKAEEFTKRAKMFYKLYKEQLGMKEGDIIPSGKVFYETKYIYDNWRPLR